MRHCMSTLGTRGFSRARPEFSLLAEGRQKPETALERSLAPRVLYEFFLAAFKVGT